MKLNITIAKTGLALLSLVTLSASIQPASAQPHSAMSSTHMTSKMASHAALTGSFRQITHATKGTATLTGTGKSRSVKLTNFETGMGPKLHVYLIPSGVTSNNDVKAAVTAKKFVDLGVLKQIKGNQSYAVPTTAKAGKGASVIVWCDKFDVVFGAATLS